MTEFTAMLTWSLLVGIAVPSTIALVYCFYILITEIKSGEFKFFIEEDEDSLA